jgi:hypothetical protein
MSSPCHLFLKYVAGTLLLRLNTTGTSTDLVREGEDGDEPQEVDHDETKHGPRPQRQQILLDPVGAEPASVCRPTRNLADEQMDSTANQKLRRGTGANEMSRWRCRTNQTMRNNCVPRVVGNRLAYFSLSTWLMA